MCKKWKVQNNNKKKKKGHLKIHISVNIRKIEILALEVTDEKTHDGKVLRKLVNHVSHSLDKRNIKSVLADGV